jgi:chorismate-pyruvate lyase
MPKPRATNARKTGRRSRSVNRILFPLDALYQTAGVDPPKARMVSPEDLPPGLRKLLVHERSMTMTLERWFGRPIGLRTLSTLRKGSSFMRRVLLVRTDTGQPVAMGAARITLSDFAPRLRARILRNKVPLGRLLREAGVDYISRPRAFLAITPNHELMGVFWMREPSTLFGRRTELIHGGRRIGDVVEILPRGRMGRRV